MKFIFALFLAVTLTQSAGAWTFRPAFNKPQSKSITATQSTPIGTYFREPGYPSDNFHSRVMSGLSNKGYSHIAVINRSKFPLSIVTVSDGGSAPDDEIEQKLYVPSSGFAFYDDISIFNYLYIMAEDGNSPREGTVEITVW